MSNKYNLDEDAGELLNIPNPTGSPERRLLLGILERAILDFVGNDEKEVESAMEWLFDEDDNSSNRFELDAEQFSFSWVCSQLDIDKKRIRERIARMPKRGIHRVAPWYFEKSNASVKGMNVKSSVSSQEFGVRKAA